MNKLRLIEIILAMQSDAIFIEDVDVRESIESSIKALMKELNINQDMVEAFNLLSDIL